MNNLDDAVKNLLYLVAAGVLILIGLVIVVGIIKFTVGLLTYLLPLALIIGAGYLIYRWWESKYGF